MKRPLRIGLTLLFTGLAVAYLVWKIDLHETIDTLLDADPWWFALAAGIMVGTALPMALRWQWLMRAQSLPDRFAWLTRAYFVSYTAGQVLPTSIGGDAMRVYETSRRHPGRTGDITAIAHDAAIVYPPGRAPYVLVVLTKGFQDEKTADSLIANISRDVYQYATRH